jgi:hypothetical protein
VLAELIERISGRDYRDFIHERVTGALGLPRVVGIPPDEQNDIGELSLCGEPASPDELEAIFGVPELPVTEVTDKRAAVVQSARRPRRRRPRRGGVATRPPSRSSTRRCSTIPTSSGTPTCSPMPPTGCATRSPTPSRWARQHALGVVVAGDDGNANGAGSGTPSRPARSATTAPAGRSPGPTPRAGCPSATSPTAAT